MKAYVVAAYQAKLPPEMQGITEENFRYFLNWRGAERELSKRIGEAFGPAVCQLAGFDDESRPPQETVSVVEVAGHQFQVTTKPTTKRPSYRQVADEFGNYLGVLSDQHSRDIRRKDVITIDGQSYVATADLRKTIDNGLATHLDGKEGISQSLEWPDGLVTEIPEELAVLFGREYSALTDSNARAYVSAELMRAEGNSRALAFKKQVLTDSLELVGETKDTIMVVQYPWSDWDVVHQIERRNTPKYKEVIEAFTKEAPERLTTRSRMGDLTLAESLYREDGFASALKEKGLVTQEFEQTYRPRRRDSTVFVLLEGAAAQLARYRAEKVTPGIEQNFAVVLR